jgi:hypothetical protein
MKLRIRGNSIRLRLSKSELASVAETGAAEDVVQFSSDTQLRYRLEVKPSGGVEAQLQPSMVRVAIPKASAERWTRSDEVSIEGEQPLGRGGVLRILVEKDYTCLTPRSEEDDSDLFANPQKNSEKRN